MSLSAFSGLRIAAATVANRAWVVRRTRSGLNTKSAWHHCVLADIARAARYDEVFNLVLSAARQRKEMIRMIIIRAPAPAPKTNLSCGLDPFCDLGGRVAARFFGPSPSCVRMNYGAPAEGILDPPKRGAPIDAGSIMSAVFSVISRLFIASAVSRSLALSPELRVIFLSLVSDFLVGPYLEIILDAALVVDSVDGLFVEAYVVSLASASGNGVSVIFFELPGGAARAAT